MSGSGPTGEVDPEGEVIMRLVLPWGDPSRPAT